MSRQIELGDDALDITWSGLSAAAVLCRHLRIPYSSIRSVAVGVDELPGVFAFRVGTTTAPLGDTRRGVFWTGSQRAFFDVNDRRQAVVHDLDGQRYDRVVLGVDDPERLAEEIRARIRRPES